MTNSGWLSILPSVLAIVLAMLTKQVFISLFVGIWLGWTILAGGNPLAGVVQALDACLHIFNDAGNTRIIVFSLLVGGIIALAQRSGGVDGFVHYVLAKKWVRDRRSAGLMGWILGVLIFIESNITVLVVGAICRPLFDRLKMPREKLAYICDSTSAPVCMSIPLNAWGAFVIGLLATQQVAEPVRLLVRALPLNFYALFSVFMVLLVVLVQKDFGPMARAERRAQLEGKVLRDGAVPLLSEEVTGMGPKEGVQPRAINMVLPVVTMVVMMPVGLYITGKGNLLSGSGSTAVFWAVCLALFVASVLALLTRALNLTEITTAILTGLGGLVPLGIILVMALALGATCNELGTGPYLAGLAAQHVNSHFVPPLLFLVASFISFSTGTSWGTFALMMPIGIPLAITLGVGLPVTLGAILGGGVFGDHCSPISDTTLISSMASASDHIDHVNTQLPYALVAGAGALLAYTLVGW